VEAARGGGGRGVVVVVVVEEEEEVGEKQWDAQHAVCWCRCQLSNLIWATRLS
jgi:hypothetical protein